MKPRILYYDIETGPNLGYVFSLWNQNLSLDQLEEQGEILCFAWKWEGESEIHSMDVWNDGLNAMICRLWELLNEADWVVTYNGRKFDNKMVHAAMIERGYSPPSPYQNIDLYQTVTANFKWPSHKLDYVLRRLGLATKNQTGGFKLWKGCMEGDWDAIDKMLRYNKQDVRVMPALYHRLRPWVPSHPNMAHFVDHTNPTCPHCGTPNVQRRGTMKTAVNEYTRFHCQDCGAWSRARKVGEDNEKVLRTSRTSR